MEGEDFTTFASVVDKHCDDFRLAELSADNFKCLIIVQELLSIKDAEFRRRILNKLENGPNITIQQVAGDSQRYVSVKQDSKKLRNLVLFASEKYATIRNKLSLPLKLQDRNKVSH